MRVHIITNITYLGTCGNIVYNRNIGPVSVDTLSTIEALASVETLSTIETLASVDILSTKETLVSVDTLSTNRTLGIRGHIISLYNPWTQLFVNTNPGNNEHDMLLFSKTYYCKSITVPCKICAYSYFLVA